MALLIAAGLLSAQAALGQGTPSSASAPPPASPAFDIASLSPKEGVFTSNNFKFKTGEKLAELKSGYITLGAPHRDSRGRVDNAVLLLHGTGGDRNSLMANSADIFAGVLFASGALLDAKKYYIISPDGIGMGLSSKPSDGLHAHFPKYDYDDMVTEQHLLLTKGLHVDHLRVIIGTSMGCMQGFVWGETYREFADALMPLACNAVQIAGRNRMWRKMAMDSIAKDPAWEGGDYMSEPLNGLRADEYMTIIAASAPLYFQKRFPTRDDADKIVESRTSDEYLSKLDANDELYQLAASRNYDPSKKLGKIKAWVMWVNSADDFINPPELGLAEQQVKEIPHGKFVLIPISDQTRGHGTHTLANVWKDYLKELLDESAPK
ncbi:MAG: alpha/beta fold hydrolase [Alphaproteobacteria bacterium]